MLAIIAALAINIAPIQDVRLDTAEGKAAFGQKLDVRAQELSQEWNGVRAKEAALKEATAKLEALSAERDAAAKKCEELASSWQEAALKTAPMLSKVEAGVKALQESGKTLELLEAYQSGKELSKTELTYLEHLSLLCADLN